MFIRHKFKKEVLYQMRKKGLLITCLAMCLVLLLAGACAGKATTTAQPVKIKLGYDTPPPTGLGVPADFFAKEVTARTDGRVTVETYPAGTLSTMGSALESLRAEVADAYVISLGANRDAFPVLSFTGLPGLDFFPHTNELLKMETDTLRAIIEKFPGAAEELEGFKMLYSCTYTSAVLMGKGEPIRTPSGIKGKKVGCDAYRQDLVEHLNGAPVFTIPPQMYEQLQTGVIDVTTVAWGAALDWQIQELVNYVYDLSFGGGQLPLVINTSVWNKISAQDQKILTAVAAEAEQKNRDFVTGQIPQARQLWKDTGIPIITPTTEELAQWEKAFAVVWNEYLEMNKGVKDIDKIFNYWKDAIYKTR
jgi:TRAP-type C4-dicarboxylate transport system substrate-binding protein